MTKGIEGELLIAGHAGSGRALVLTAPISFWGGIDPKSGDIIDARHPQRGKSIAGRVLFLPGTIGSSSASAVLLELVKNGHAPEALVMDAPDAILLLGFIVAREMGWPSPLAIGLAARHFPLFDGKIVDVAEDGCLTIKDD